MNFPAKTWVPDVRLERDDGEGEEDEVEAAEAVLERHEVEVRVGAGEVHLDDVHVRHVGHHEDHREGRQEEEVEQRGRGRALGRQRKNRKCSLFSLRTNPPL